MTDDINHDLQVRPLQEAELDAAHRVMRLAFDTFVGFPERAAFMGDAGFVRPLRYSMGQLRILRSLTIRPDLCDRGIGQRLMEQVMGLYERLGFWPRFLTRNGDGSRRVQHRAERHAAFESP